MKIKTLAIISLHADPTIPSGVGEGGGTHLYLRELITGLASKGRKCILFTRRTSLSLPEHEVISRFAHIYRINIGPVGYLRKECLDDYHENSVKIILDIIKGFRKQIFLVHSVYWNSGKVALDISKELNILYVHTVISNGIRKRLEGSSSLAKSRIEVEKEVYNKAFRIFSISRSEKKDLVELYGVDPKSIVVVGRPVNIAFRELQHDELGNPRRIVLSELKK